jgi:DNA-binding CsgD family transcriptional regulator/predicted PurR-regulated permease PerM
VVHSTADSQAVESRSFCYFEKILFLMRLLFCVVFLLIAFAGLSQPKIDSLLGQLNQEIEKRPQYVDAKLKRIESLKSAAIHADADRKFLAYSAVYNEYKSFIYDSAFLYARRLQKIARELKSPSVIADTKVKVAFILVSSGMFNEALDSLQSVTSSDLPDSTRSDYYYIMARACYDLADFNRDDFYRKIYTNRAHAYIDSALTILPKRSAQYLLMEGLQNLHLRRMDIARKDYEDLINEFNLTSQQFAIAASTLSFIYFYTDQPEKAKEMLIRAAIADIRSCTKETTAMLNLADLLHKEGDIETAYKFVKIAMEDADYYGARQRRNQVAAVFPVIEGRQLQMVESRQKTLILYSSVITIFTIMVIGFLVIIFKQNKKLQKARQIISQANESLTETNHQLQDANKIKEEYIWYYFNTTAEYISKLDALKKSLDLKLMTKKLEDLRYTVDSINIKRERDELYHNFDKVFLKLFPDFVTVFNSLFKEEDRMVLKDGQLLNTELRIFALIRMGIHDHERIAKILDYSVTTIYTYKTRVRNKSTLPNEEFDRQIMAIRAI